jgi:HD-GYP domain-containing protein (c-di-GMP phosphodiesterase class II)
MARPINLELPGNLFIRNRLSQEGPLIFKLAPKFRDSLLAQTTGVAPNLPATAPLALHETMSLVTYYNTLVTSSSSHELLQDYLPPLCKRLAELAQRAPDGIIASILLCTWQNYATHHAINTALLGYRLSKALEITDEQCHILLQAALLMNLGSITLHNEMAKQDAPPSTLQRQLLDAHPLFSSAMVREGGLEDERLHQVLLTHHERLDGRGYPFGLKDGDIDPLAQLLHLLDCTIAKLMPRSYRSSVPARNALADVYRGTTEKFDTRYTTQLVKVLGIYPPGSFVELESGETAIVVAQTEQATAPRVATPLSKYNLIDTTDPGRRITKSVPLKVGERFLSKLAPFWSLQ